MNSMEVKGKIEHFKRQKLKNTMTDVLKFLTLVSCQKALTNDQTASGEAV